MIGIQPEPGDFCCIPVHGWMGTGIELGQFLAGDRFQPYEHSEIYVGQADKAGPYGYTYSAYPDNGRPGKTGKRPLPCPAADLPGAIWSTGIIPLSQTERSGIVQWCQEHPDVLYSWIDYDAIALKRFGVRSEALRDYIASTGRMICSYYTDAGLLYGAGIHLFSDGRWPGEVTPGDLADLLETLRGAG